MPALYLLDAIIGNHVDPYRDIFQENIVSTFAMVVEANEDPHVVTELSHLRNSWSSYFDPRILNNIRLVRVVKNSAEVGMQASGH